MLGKNILYFSILLHSFNTEYLEFKKWMCYIDGQKNKKFSVR
jgi:hypothetical protein